MTIIFDFAWAATLSFGVMCTYVGSTTIKRYNNQEINFTKDQIIHYKALTAFGVFLLISNIILCVYKLRQWKSI